MDNIYDIWLLVGRETEGTSIKNYIFMHYNGNTQFIQKRSIIKFCREHNVLNVQINGDNIVGKGIAITALPRYVKQQGFGLQQVGGISQDEVRQLAEPLINQYIQKKDAELRKKQENSIEAQKDKQNNYISNKLNIIESLINIALDMKDVTNDLASNGQFTRYIKQIDIDNAEGDSLTNLIQRQGVNGLANGLSNRLDRIKDRIHKQGLDKAFILQANELKSKCEELKKLHSKTKGIIKDNKLEDSKQKILLEKQFTEIDDIPVVEDSSDMIQVDYEDTIPIVDDIETGDIEIDQSAIFKQEQPSKEDKELNDKIDELCKLYSRAITNIGNIIHNPSRISEIAHDIDMEYPGIHKSITKDKINSHYNSEEDIVKDISDHYDYIIAEENRGKLWRNLLTNHLGKEGTEIYNMTFRLTNYPDNERLNKLIEQFDYCIDTLIKSITDKLSEDKEQCIQKALQNFTKISQSKREQMLEEIYGDSWYNAGNSLEEYGSKGWGGWTADEAREEAKRDTLAHYEGLSDEEFMQKLKRGKMSKLAWKRSELFVRAFPEEVNSIYLEKKGISFGESYKLSNYDRGESKHREKRQIASELLKTTRVDLLELSDKEYEITLRSIEDTFKNNIINTIQSMVDDVISDINNLSLSDVIEDNYSYSIRVDASHIYDAIKNISSYCYNIEQEYSVYLFKDNPFNKDKLNKMVRDTIDGIEKEYKKLKNNSNRQSLAGLDDISELFSF